MRHQWRDDRPVVGAQDVELLILAEAHLNRFVIALHGAPSAAVPVFALGVGPLHVEVLRVAVERGVAPGDVLIVAGDDHGHAG